MALEDTKQLKLTSNHQYANELLAAGWTLISVQDFTVEGDQMSRYILGWQKDGEPVHVEQTQW